RNLLSKLVEQFELCPKLCFIQKNNDACTGVRKEACACEGHEGINEYNNRIQVALETLKETLPTFALRDEGRTPDEHSCLLIEDGHFYGMGYISQYFQAD